MLSQPGMTAGHMYAMLYCRSNQKLRRARRGMVFTHGRPADAAAEDHDGVDLGDPVRAREAPLEDVKEDRDGEADGERGEKSGVDAAGPEHLAGAQAAEEDCGGEVGVDAGAGEAVFLVAVKVVRTTERTLVRRASYVEQRSGMFSI